MNARGSFSQPGPLTSRRTQAVNGAGAEAKSYKPDLRGGGATEGAARTSCMPRKTCVLSRGIVKINAKRMVSGSSRETFMVEDSPGREHEVFFSGDEPRLGHLQNCVMPATAVGVALAQSEAELVCTPFAHCTGFDCGMHWRRVL